MDLKELVIPGTPLKYYLKLNNSNELNIDLKNPNSQEADQLAMYKCKLMS